VPEGQQNPLIAGRQLVQSIQLADILSPARTPGPEQHFANSACQFREHAAREAACRDPRRKKVKLAHGEATVDRCSGDGMASVGSRVRTASLTACATLRRIFHSCSRRRIVVIHRLVSTVLAIGCGTSER
jgi:hypothetical protein